MPIKPHMTQYKDGSFEFYVPYSPEFLSHFKKMVPYKDREHDYDSHIWRVHSKEFLHDVIDLVEEYFGDVEIRKG